MKLDKFALLLALTVASAGAWAKLPPPSEEAKAKAEEAKLKAAETAKTAAEQLARAQDRVAAAFIAAAEGQRHHRHADADCTTGATRRRGAGGYRPGCGSAGARSKEVTDTVRQRQSPAKCRAFFWLGFAPANR